MKAEIFNHQIWVKETNPVILKKLFDGILIESGFGVLKKVEHHFKPFGWTCLWLLSESHLAIHTFPEEGKSYVELSSCIRAPFDKFVELTKTK